jgi:D-alanyl-D-alanine-carboxypeptidase/D-alanyl-D-alanine-endopeptidase
MKPGPGSGRPAPGTRRAVLRERLRLQGVGFVALQTDASGARFAAVGQRDVREAAAPDADTRFEWGSITKTFTALLLAEMVVHGDLELEDAVEAALPAGTRLRDSADEPIRWVDLATHRSGLPRLPLRFVPPDMADPYAAFDTAQMEEVVARWKPAVPRNERYEYSNLGYGLLGHALGRRAGPGYAAALRTRVLQPLGLGEVVLRTRDAQVARAAQGHDAERRPVPPWHFDALAGAGALVGSARELARYAQCATERVDHPLQAAFRLALQRQADGPTPANPVGLGWILGKLNGRPIANHDGGTFGFSSSLFIDLQQRRSAGVLANAFVPVTDIALHLLDGSVPLHALATEQTAARAAAETTRQPPGEARPAPPRPRPVARGSLPAPGPAPA